MLYAYVMAGAWLIVRNVLRRAACDWIIMRRELVRRMYFVGPILDVLVYMCPGKRVFMDLGCESCHECSESGEEETTGA